MNKTTTKTEKINFVLAFLLGLSLASLVLFFNYTNAKFKDLIEKKAEYVKSVVNSKALKFVEKDLRFLQSANKTLENLYLDADNVVDFISNIESLARGANTAIEIKSISSSEVKIDEKKFEDLQDFTIVAELSGLWKDVNKYIEIIENLPHHININELRLIKKSGGSDDEDDDVYEANLEISVIAK